MMRTRFPLAAFAALSALSVLACRKEEELPPADSVAAAPAPPAASVTTIETGRHIGTDMRISDTTTTFAPRDTLFVSVVTSNATGSNTLKGVLTFQGGTVVDSATQVIAAPVTTGGSSVTELHWVKPGGWPVGDYTVEVWLDGQSAGTRTLTVKR
jgi:hypothetical protein